MISSVCLNNFKPFEAEFLEFRSLTLLSGLNSTGKSSVLQSLLLLRQSYQQGLLPKTGLALNGDFVCIGTAQDALFEDAKENSIGFELIWKDGNQGTWLFNYNREADVLALASQPTAPDIYQSSLFSDHFHYIQAERLGPRTYFEISDFQVRQHQQLGTRGEYTAHFLSIYRDKDIPNSNLCHPEAKSLNLVDQAEAWIGEVSPGTRIEIKSNLDMDLVSFQYSYGLSNPYRATNVGFGITYTLPILVAVLASEPGTLILIENPEAHLHPKGQSKMGELLALAASCGVQVMIETHSDHVLNGIRRVVHVGKLDHQDVQLHYFQRQEKEGQAFTEVVSPRIKRSGRIDKWPDGFFDQMEKDLMELI
jgi:predicted ATPase